MQDSTEPTLEGRLEAIEHLLAVCAARVITADQIEKDRLELQSVVRARSIAGLAESDEWVRSQNFCKALDQLLLKVQSLQT